MGRYEREPALEGHKTAGMKIIATNNDTFYARVCELTAAIINLSIIQFISKSRLYYPLNSR